MQNLILNNFEFYKKLYCLKFSNKFLTKFEKVLSNLYKFLSRYVTIKTNEIH